MSYELPKSLTGFNIFMVGIKGTGMTALAELLTRQGALITGSDIPQRFFTDTLLERAGIAFLTEFKAENIKNSIQLVIHSSAYSIETNPELIRAKELGIPTMIYTEALGFISSLSYSVGIAGIHGKTTTTALTGTIIKALGLPASTLVGSGVPSFDDSAIYVEDNKYFIAETCEYQRHFLDFHPSLLLITSIEMDHPDYFKDIEDIEDAFLSYIGRLPSGGAVIYCADDIGANRLIESSKKLNGDVRYIPYGEGATGRFSIDHLSSEKGINSFKLSGFKRTFKLQVPGHHTILDAAGGVAIATLLLENEGIDPLEKVDQIAEGLYNFRGTKRRSEILGEKNGILFIDDYGHHPTAVETTLKGYRKFYPDRRIIVDFMSHTYTRTAQLLEAFASAFSSADIVILNKIYGSAREGYSGSVTGETLYMETAKRHKSVYYCPEYDDAVEKLRDILRPGDLFVTMGAGNNWQVGERLYKELDE